MTLDELIAAADPARERHVAGGNAADAQELIKQLAADSRSASAGPRRQRRAAEAEPRSPRRAGRRGDIAIPVIGVMVAVLVTGFALLGHERRGRLRPPAPQSTKTHFPAGVVALGPDTTVDRALINELSVLREPQTAAARRFNASPTGGARLAQQLPLVTALTRVIPLAHREITSTSSSRSAAKSRSPAVARSRGVAVSACSSAPVLKASANAAQPQRAFAVHSAHKPSPTPCLDDQTGSTSSSCPTASQPSDGRSQPPSEAPLLTDPCATAR